MPVLDPAMLPQMQGAPVAAPQQELPPVAPQAPAVTPDQLPAKNPNAPAVMPGDLNAMFRSALTQDLSSRYSPEAMAAREKAMMDDLAAKEAAAQKQQQELDRQRKWVGLMGLGAALQGQDPSRVMNPFLEQRDSVAKRLEEISAQRKSLPQTLADERLKGLMAMGDAFDSYNRAVKAGQPERASPTSSQWMADRVAAAASLFPGMDPVELANRPDLLFSPDATNAYNRALATRGGVVAEETAKGRRKGAPPVGRSGGSGSGGKTGKPNVSGMSAGDLLKNAGL